MNTPRTLAAIALSFAGMILGFSTAANAASPVAVTGVSLNSNNAAITVGATYQLVANVSPSDATDKSVNWSLSNNSVISVDQNGLVKAIGIGVSSVTVTTNDGGFTDLAIINISAPPPSFNMNVSAPETVTKGVAATWKFFCYDPNAAYSANWGDGSAAESSKNGTWNHTYARSGQFRQFLRSPRRDPRLSTTWQ